MKRSARGPKPGGYHECLNTSKCPIPVTSVAELARRRGISQGARQCAQTSGENDFVHLKCWRNRVPCSPLQACRSRHRLVSAMVSVLDRAASHDSGSDTPGTVENFGQDFRSYVHCVKQGLDCVTEYVRLLIKATHPVNRTLLDVTVDHNSNNGKQAPRVKVYGRHRCSWNIEVMCS